MNKFAIAFAEWARESESLENRALVDFSSLMRDDWRAGGCVCANLTQHCEAVLMLSQNLC